MRKPATLPAFTDEERTRAHVLLATRVSFMMGRKFEEADWAEVYCGAKNIPLAGWSNLNIDVMHKGLGVEHKMLCYRSNARIAEACGSTLMHPAATRSIRVPSPDTDPNQAMRDVLRQYADLIDQRRAKVQETSPGFEPDMRTGWLLWQESLQEFLYFEEEMLRPNPRDYYAEWITRDLRGGRKASTSLWIYERKTGRKRYSVTTSAGAKVQPYFDVPPPNDPNVYIFTVQGEVIEPGRVRMWVTEGTARELRHMLGDLGMETVSSAILEASRAFLGSEPVDVVDTRTAKPIVIATEAYAALRAMFPNSISDEHRAQLFVQYLQGAQESLLV
jgi:hypothetical protein